MTPHQQLTEFIKEGCLRAALYFKTTLGLPEDIFFEEWDKLETGLDKANFLNNMYLEHPKIFEGMPRYQP